MTLLLSAYQKKECKHESLQQAPYEKEYTAFMLTKAD
jgi:hypothetical protein